VTLLGRLFILVMIALAPSILVLAYDQFELYRTQLAAIENDVLQAATQVAAEEGQETEAVRQLLLAVASLESVREQNSEACNTVLAGLAPHYPSYAFLGAVNRDGVRFCSSATPFPGRDSLVDRPFFKQVMHTHDFAVGEHRISLVGKVHVLDFGGPYFDADGVLQGVVYAGLSLDRMIAKLSAHPRPIDSELIVADRNGLVIASAPDPSWIGKSLPEAHRGRLGLNVAGTADLPGLDGIVRLFGYVPVAASDSRGIYVAYGLEKRAAMAYARTSIARGIAASAIGITVALVMTFWYGRRFIRRPVSALLAAAERWRKGDWSARALTAETKTEFGQLAGAFNEMAGTAQAELEHREQTEMLLMKSHSEVLDRSRLLEAQTKTIGLLASMAYRMQSCATEKELADVVSRFAPEILPGITGALYLLSDSRNRLRSVASWNAPPGLETECAPSDCWPLRQAHPVTAEGLKGICSNLRRDNDLGYSCRPLVAQGETIGLLCLEAVSSVEGLAAGNAATGHDLDIFAENISLAMGNLRLRESLRNQSIRDPLTGLFNRRYLEEALELDLARIRRSNLPFSVIMGDADHFKKINDTFGHDAGDLVLRCIADVIQANIRKGDLACRYGGEEFVILLHGADTSEAAARAETIRQAIKSMEVAFRGQSLGPVTISLGVATFPRHAQDGAALITAADGAMYTAKHAGRDRVEISSGNLAESPPLAELRV
jgi:diguanylate cyclase (GGDEF)-like protein